MRPFWGLGGGPGSRANGLGQAYTALADDATALYYNPGGLAHLYKAEFSAGVSQLFTSNYVDGIGQGLGSGLTASRVDNLALVLPLVDAKGTLAMGYQLIYNFEDSWEETLDIGDSLLVTRTQEDGAIGQWSFGFGYQVDPTVGLGVTVDILSGRNLYHYKEWSTLASDVEDFYLKIAPTYQGLRASFGIIAQPLPVLRFGVTIRSSQVVNIVETFSNTDYPDPEVYRYRTTSPFMLRLGAALIGKNLRLTGDIETLDYRQVEITSNFIDPGTGTPIDPGINAIISNDYVPRTRASLGAEFLLPGINVKIRSGLRYEPSILEPRFNVPDWLTYAIGASLLVTQQFKVDGALATTTERGNGRVTLLASQLAINIIYRF